MDKLISLGSSAQAPTAPHRGSAHTCARTVAGQDLRAFTLYALDDSERQTWTANFSGLTLSALQAAGMALPRFVAAGRVPTQRQLILQCMASLRRLSRARLADDHLNKLAVTAITSMLGAMLTLDVSALEVSVHPYFDHADTR